MSLGLGRIQELLNLLGRPQDSLRFVHVAGTNGKGSTCAFVASILHQAAYRVGSFTSPALYCFEDRIRVNGINISFDDLCEITETVKQAAESMKDHPTEFELLTAVALCHFARQHCDIVVMEVGLGGRLDSTNVVEDVEVSVVTPISFDHCALLGSTLQEIAHEKAGIIKPKTPVVSAPQDRAVLGVLDQVAGKLDAPLTIVDSALLSGTPQCFSYRGRADLTLGLSGSFQLVNAATALDTIDSLRAHGWNISEEAIREGLAHASWPGRFDRVSEDPLVILDGGHNVAGLEALERALEETYPGRHRIVLTGVLEDKDYPKMAQLLVRFADELITVTPLNPRALPAARFAEVLQTVAHEHRQDLSATAAPDLAGGVRRALQRASEVATACASEDPADCISKQPLICVCGSLYMLSSVMEVLRQADVAL